MEWFNRLFRINDGPEMGNWEAQRRARELIDRCCDEVTRAEVAARAKELETWKRLRE